ncbi:putative TATA element modulatory factor 1, TATA binding protein [Helianthus annuus]|nr:putative TATA element modulatory factor 1, TATA binding protein [Helianthus annuus]
MAWLRGRVALDLAGAVNKISESVKNIEKNFDNALGLEDQHHPGASTSTVDASHTWSPEFMAFVGQKDGNDTAELSKKASKESESSEKHDDSVEKHDESLENHESSSHPKEGAAADDSINSTEEHQDRPAETNFEMHAELDSSAEKHVDTNTGIRDHTDSIVELPEEAEKNAEKSVEINPATSYEATVIADNHIKVEAEDREKSRFGSTNSFVSKADEFASYDGQDAIESDPHGLQNRAPEAFESVKEGQLHLLASSDDAFEMVPDVVFNDENENAKVCIVNQFAGDERNTGSGRNTTDNADSTVEMQTLKMELKKMETALLGAARQAQAKADEIAKLMNENEQLKAIAVDQKRKSDAATESLQEEYRQRVSALEKKVYGLMRERDTLRREQNKRSDAAALLKEKDEIITQVMAEGEELSKKQAVQESTIRKLRAQIREFEEEKKGLTSKLQIEENKMENFKKDKATTEKLLQETIDKNKAELVAQNEHFTNALNAAKKEKSLTEARANKEARTEFESYLKATEEREAMLVQTLEELRQTLSRKEQQAVYREDMLRKDIDDLQKRYQASERRCEELVMQVPESTRPLLRQIEAMQEATARKADAWDEAERSLNLQLQDAEAKAAAAEEKERSVNEHLSKTLSRINVLEAQISCLKTEQTQLSKSLEKERQRASESRQDYLALKEEADTLKGHVHQLEEEMKKLKRKHKLEMQETLTQHNLLQQDIEREKAARIELEKTSRHQVSTVPGHSPIAKTKFVSANGLTRRLSARSLSSMEESFFPRAIVDSYHTFSERSHREPTISPFYLKSMTPDAFQAALRQKEGEVASYMSRLASMETIRDSLSEELVKMTKECKKLRSEAALLPGIKAELEALRFRHTAALELMGERDEELEELRADIADLKEMYREQVNMLVDKIQKGSSIKFPQ